MGYLSMPTALAAHERVTSQFSKLLRTAPDGAQPILHLTWSVGEIGAHVLSGLVLYTAMLAGGPPPWQSLLDGDAENARHLAEISEREPALLADAIDVAAPDFRNAFATYSEELAPWHAGLRVLPEVLVGLVVGDILVHGWDLATAVGRNWVIDPPDACLSFSAAVPVMAHFVDQDAARGISATYCVRLRGGPTFTLLFADGTLTTAENRPSRADCRMSVDPVAYLLTAYGRVPVWRQVIRGRLVGYGRRPWLGLKLTSLLRNP